MTNARTNHHTVLQPIEIIDTRKRHGSSKKSAPKESERLRRQLARSQKAQNKLRQRLADGRERFKARVSRLKKRFKEEQKRLKDLLSEARRTGKRQAAPFSKGDPKDKKKRKKPGRRSGKKHGRHGHRPRPERTPDQVLDAVLPERSSCCGAEVEKTSEEPQFQVDIPKVQATLTQFNVHKGHRCNCNKPIQGRHPQQTSNALGAAASQVGPNTYAFATDVHTGCGVSYAKTSDLLQRWFDISITKPNESCICVAFA